MKWALICVALVTACGDDAKTCPGPFGDGDPNGHPDPLGASAGEARAGRIHAADLPTVPSGLITWQDGDFVLANDKVALVIEDTGDSDLYDPWGGRPVGLARVENGKLVEPNNFGEVFLLTGRSTVLTESVSVINDGSDGHPAIVRARGKLHPMPFIENLVSVLFNDQYLDIDATIDYQLAPDAEHVDVFMHYSSQRELPTHVPSTLHAVMYTNRTSPSAFQPGLGFDETLNSPYLALVQDDATSWAYSPGDGMLTSSIAASGFLGAFSPGFDIPACGTAERLHAKIVIGGPGLDGIQAAAARVLGETQRTITGTVTRGGVPAPGVHVHAVEGEKYFTRTTTNAAGEFTLHVPADANVHLDAFKPGDAAGSAEVGSGTTATIDLPAQGAIHVTTTENGVGVPVRVQVLATNPPRMPSKYGEQSIAGSRVYVEFPVTGDITLPIAPGSYEVIVSRGYEYEIVRQNVTVTAAQTTQVDALLDHVVDTTGIQCGDFHVHTWRSNDSGDDSVRKVAQAVADGVELPVRSDHEYVDDFKAEIAKLGVEAFAIGFGSVELTSMEIWGHMGVFPLTPDATKPNGGAPHWQTWPTADALDTPFQTLEPPVVFDSVRARSEAPVVIINHPRGGANYFDYVGFDPATGLADVEGAWDTKFTLVEVFNDSGWQANKNRNVADWFGLLRAGRKVLAVGSSDTHGISSSPVGYPRTCLSLGTDDPRALTANQVRDTLAAGHTMISGGIYVTARLGNAGPGDSVTGAGSPMMVDVTIQAPTWIDVDAIDVVVDGSVVDTITVMPADADPNKPSTRWRGQIPVQVQASGGFVVIAAYGAKALDPIHPGRIPFGVTNPIFVTP
ncbi:MAG TPA: CehA/McbA family metallohydrolase [Kofleriaceae bacterium]|nr:CehA/McbA family metallohydrolase [Kofleriaceae bacterium]